MNPLVTIVTATTGTKYLKQNLDSVSEQTYKNIQHLIVIDGKDGLSRVNSIDFEPHGKDWIALPYATGTNQYNGHRIYGAATYLAKGDYIHYLDEDNWIDPNHVESLVMAVSKSDSNKSWAYSLRKITNMNGQFICNDDCESLGAWQSVLNDYFIDVNCFFLPLKIALQLTPFWYRRARHPDDQPEVDRMLTTILRAQSTDTSDMKMFGTGEYTVNYRAGNRADSVQPEFFMNGNNKMAKIYEGNFPWRKATK
jgi:glycosyltransferase involved in cell wall biosynthesis